MDLLLVLLLASTLVSVLEKVLSLALAQMTVQALDLASEKE